MSKFPTLIHTLSGQYPVSRYDLANWHQEISFGTEFDPALMQALGYAEVKDSPMPAGDKVTLAPAPLLDPDTGVYTQVWVVSEFSVEEKAKMLKNQADLLSSKINSALQKTIELGAPIDFGGSDGVQHMQMRDGDRANILGLRVSAEAVLNAPTPYIFRIRTQENKNISLNAQKVIALSWLILASYTEALELAWALKDACDAAESIEALPTDAAPEIFTLAVTSL